ncbi:MAG: DUF2142 domain-containing protein [Solirubrobacteraceae bacterium]|nr:DUF2142 domain-containing protein [Solirubrobacteraceae bacterium]
MTDAHQSDQHATDAELAPQSQRLSRFVLAALVIVALAQGALWAVLTPPLNGPDEESHAPYAQYLAETGKPPELATGTGSLSPEITSLVRGLGASSLVGNPTGRIDWPASSAVNQALAQLPPESSSTGSGPNAAANYPPLYYGLVAIAYRITPSGKIADRLLAMRLVGVLLFGLTVALTWMLAAVVLAGLWPRVVAAGLVALQPKLGFTAAVINPDILITAIATGFILAAALIICRGLNTRRAIAILALTAAGALTHPRGYFLVAPLLFVAWFSARRAAASRDQRDWITAVDALGIAMIAAAAAATAVLIARWGNSAPVSDVREFGSYIWNFYLPRPDFLTQLGPEYGYQQVFIRSFFSDFGQLDVTPSATFVSLVQNGVMLALIALYSTVVARWSTIRKNWPLVAMLLAFLLSMLLLVHLVSYRELQANGDPIITGRYLLTAVGIYGIAAAWVMSSLPRRAGPVIGACVLSIGAVLALSGIGLTALRFYG